MNNEFRKPYLASIYGVQPRHRVFVYPRETLIEKDIFPFYILDGGAFFFMKNKKQQTAVADSPDPDADYREDDDCYDIPEEAEDEEDYDESEDE